MKSFYTETSLNSTVHQSFSVQEILYEEQTQFQKIEVVKTHALGKVLLLDGAGMISDKDEFIYHEVMTHIPCLVQERTKNVLVIGAGDGGVIRELCRYPSIESIKLIEIDEAVPRVCREFFPDVSGSLDDKRVEVICCDGARFVQESIQRQDQYDLIISDSTDPIGMAKVLYQREFFSNVFSLLGEEGIFMSQSETPFYDEFNIKEIYSELKSVFPIVQAVCAPMLIYPGVYWTFAFCSKKELGTSLKDHKVMEYKEFESKLSWHNLEWHKGAFSLSRYVQEKLGLT